MVDCSHISLMLGPFEDQALEPHEYQEVAFHLARCEKCTAELADYGALGRELRTIFTPELPLEGFKDAVMKRITEIPVPLSARLGRFFGSIGDFFPSGIGLTTAAAVAAALTVVIAGPYARMLVNRSAPTHEIAKVERAVEAVPKEGIASVRQDVEEMEEEPEPIISKLESDIPSVAVWNEPKMDTTVIWLPDQP
ncbi:MAG: anti-sigma factor family protein [Candidatus Binataceae bacterium]